MGRKRILYWMTGFVLCLALAYILYVFGDFAYNDPYLSADTAFNQAASIVMPSLDSFDETAQIEYHHSKRNSDEWVVLKAVYASESFAHQKEQIADSYTFYEEDLILGAPFCASESIYSIDDYSFSVVKLDAYQEDPQYPYAFAVAVNEQEHSILYLFVSSDSFQYMGVDGITRIIWSYIGVTK